MTQNGEHKPTVNGIVKGRPGKGRVLSLGQRRRCYAQHAMDEDNTFRYTPKATKAQPKPLERAWCKRCRADSRKRSRAKRLLEAKAAARLQRGADKAHVEEVRAALQPKAKASTPKTRLKARAAEGKVGCGNCHLTFDDALAASEHIIGCKVEPTPTPIPAKGKARKRAKVAARKAA